MSETHRSTHKSKAGGRGSALPVRPPRALNRPMRWPDWNRQRVGRVWPPHVTSSFRGLSRPRQKLTFGSSPLGAQDIMRTVEVCLYRRDLSELRGGTHSVRTGSTGRTVGNGRQPAPGPVWLRITPLGRRWLQSLHTLRAFLCSCCTCIARPPTNTCAASVLRCATF